MTRVVTYFKILDLIVFEYEVIFSKVWQYCPRHQPRSILFTLGEYNHIFNGHHIHKCFIMLSCRHNGIQNVYGNVKQEVGVVHHYSLHYVLCLIYIATNCTRFSSCIKFQPLLLENRAHFNLRSCE